MSDRSSAATLAGSRFSVGCSKRRAASSVSAPLCFVITSAVPGNSFCCPSLLRVARRQIRGLPRGVHSPRMSAPTAKVLHGLRATATSAACPESNVPDTGRGPARSSGREHLRRAANEPPGTRSAPTLSRPLPGGAVRVRQAHPRVRRLKALYQALLRLMVQRRRPALAAFSPLWVIRMARSVSSGSRCDCPPSPSRHGGRRGIFVPVHACI
jgi:hypothetical protein